MYVPKEFLGSPPPSLPLSLSLSLSLSFRFFLSSLFVQLLRDKRAARTLLQSFIIRGAVEE